MNDNWLKYITKNFFASSFDDDENLVLEWMNKKKSITLYICNDNILYLKAWGPNIISEMDEGEIKEIKDFKELIKWMNDED